MDNQHVSYFENWKILEENPRYEVSDNGRIRFTDSKELKYVCLNKQGYYSVDFKIDGKKLTRKIHRLVAQTFLPPPSQELVEKCSKEHWGQVLVKHIDNNKTNNCVSNLAWCDLLENTKEAWRDGLISVQRGSLNAKATLTEELVHTMCKDFESGMMPSKAVEKYKVSKQQATKIRAGFQWKHIWCQYDIKVNRRNKNIND